MHTNALHFYTPPSTFYVFDVTIFILLFWVSTDKLLELQLFLILLSFNLYTRVIGDLTTTITLEYFDFNYMFTFTSEFYTFMFSSLVSFSFNLKNLNTFL